MNHRAVIVLGWVVSLVLAAAGGYYAATMPWGSNTNAVIGDGSIAGTIVSVQGSVLELSYFDHNTNTQQSRTFFITGTTNFEELSPLTVDQVKKLAQSGGLSTTSAPHLPVTFNHTTLQKTDLKAGDSVMVIFSQRGAGAATAVTVSVLALESSAGAGGQTASSTAPIAAPQTQSKTQAQTKTQTQAGSGSPASANTAPAPATIPVAPPPVMPPPTAQ